MSSFLQLSLVLVIIILAAKAGGWVSVRLRQPAVLGELLAGLLLGPTVIDLLHLPVFASPSLEETVFNLAELGAVMLMFIAGMEVDLGEMRSIGRPAVPAGVLGVLVPLVAGALVAIPFGYAGAEAIFIGIMLTATSTSISAQTLIELGMLRTREGMAMLGAAIVDDILVIILLSVFLELTGGDRSTGAFLLVVARIVVYLGLAAVAGWFVLPPLMRWVDRQPISEGLASLVLASVLLFAWAAEAVGGLAAITGAFLAGVGLSRSPLRDKTEGKMRTITYAFLVPIFFVSIGLQANARTITGPSLVLLLALLLTAILSKILGSGVGARLGGFRGGQALRVGVGMVSRGEMGLIVAAAGVSRGLVDPAMFSIVVVIVLLTTIVTPILLRLVYPRPGPAEPVGAQEA
ncbi:MAG TPA: cation:proton antiporter [Anaerolineales bacterium]|nr:cation:proton antiporter [Anaerolineales bacterium]